MRTWALVAGCWCGLREGGGGGTAIGRHSISELSTSSDRPHSSKNSSDSQICKKKKRRKEKKKAELFIRKLFWCFKCYVTCWTLKDESATFKIPDILNFRKQTNSNSVSCPSTFFFKWIGTNATLLFIFLSFFNVAKTKSSFFSLYFATLQYLCVIFFP